MNAERLIQFMSEGTTESSRRLIAYRCAMVLLVIDCALASVISYQGMNFRAVDNGILTAFGALNLFIVGLAREIYHRKPENVGSQAQPASGAGASVSEPSTEAAGAKIEGQP